MDTGSKSLAQLSEEGKEKKFISIEVGSKVSGYTKDYLERLCRLNKVEYRLRDNGAFAIELESLLNETHTILLSYEGVTFIEKSELTIPEKPEEGKILSSALQDVHSVAVASMIPESAPLNEAIPDHFAQSVPRFGDVNKLSQQVFGGNPFSFVGRTVVSDGKTPDVSVEKETHIPIGAGAGTPALKEIPVAQNTTDTNISFHAQESTAPVAPIPSATSVLEQKEEVTPNIASTHVPLHIPISVSHEEKNIVETIPKVVQHIPVMVPHKPSERVKLAVTRDTTPENPADDWDALLFSEGHTTPLSNTQPEDSKSEVVIPSAVPISEVPSLPIPEIPTSTFDIASPYRPIKTSMDATEHHEGGALFPEISKVPMSAPVPVNQKNERPPSFVPTGGQKVIVFDPQSLMHADSAPLKTPPPAPKMIIPRAIPIDPETQNATPPLASSEVEKKPIAPSSVVALGEQVEKQIVPKVPLATMRVMPQVPEILEKTLPEILPEHHLLIREKHPLLARRGLNVVFGLFIGATSLIILGGMATGKIGVELNSASYVAGVRNFDEPLRPSVSPVPYTLSPEDLPFSNELVVSTSSTSNSVRVTPVFTDGEGTTYQYEMVQLKDVSAGATSSPE